MITTPLLPTDRNEIAATLARPRERRTVFAAPHGRTVRPPEFRTTVLDDKRLGGRTMAASLAAHSLVAASLAGAGLYGAGAVAPPAERLVVSFYEPRPEETPRLQSVGRRVEEPSRTAPIRAARRLPPPIVPNEPEARVPAPEAPRPEPARQRDPEPVRERVAPRELPRPVVRTETFDAPAPARNPAAVPEPAIRQGVFDALEAPSARGGRGVPVPAGERLGVFETDPVPATAGHSDRGAAGTGAVGHAGFDGEPAAHVASASTGITRDEIRPAGFENAAHVAAPRRPLQVETTAPDEPLEILSKPRPDYTEEGRRLRVEGDVILEVLFPASGAPRVLRVVRGLGHGLNEAAIEAAGRIAFRPARRGGRPVDQTATVRVVFQLAY